MSWTLEIFHSGATQTYAASLIERDDDAAVAERLQADTVEQANIKLSIDQTFLGASEIFGLPVGDGSGELDWRARVLYDGVEALNGIVRRRGGVQHDPDEERWNVTVMASGTGDFLDRLEAVPLLIDGERNGAIFAVDYVHVRLTDFDGVDRYMQAYLLASLWTRLLAAISDVTFTSPPLFEYTTEYITGGVTETITRQGEICVHTFPSDLRVGETESLPFTLPDITGRQLFEALQIMEGWRIEANYAAYPSRAIDVDAFVDSEALAFGAGADLDDPADAVVELAGRPILDIEDPEFPDMAVAYLYDEINPKPILHYEFDGSGLEAVTHPIASPAPAGLYAAETHKQDPDGRPANETVHTIPFLQPWIAYVQLVTGQNPFSGTDPNYEERWAIAGYAAALQGDRGKGFVFEVGQVEGAPGLEYRMIINRSVTAVGGIPATQDTFFCAVWAQQALRKYVLSRRELFTCEVSVDALDQAAFQVGRPGEGVQYLSRTWMVAERQFEPVNERTELLLKTPTPEAVPDVPPGAEPERLNPPHAITAGCTCDDVNNEFDLTLSWSAPITGLTPTSYEVEYMAWYQETWQTGTDTASTSWSFSHPTNGNERGSFFFRLRSVLTNASGEEEVSPWVHGRVACSACGDDDDPDDGDSGFGTGTCYEQTHFRGTILAGQSSVWVAPDPALSVDLDDASEEIRFLLTSRSELDPGTELYISDLEAYRLQVSVGQASASPVAAGANINFDGLVSRRRIEDPACAPCFRARTWHSFETGYHLCAPFAGPTETTATNSVYTPYNPFDAANRRIFTCRMPPLTGSDYTGNFLSTYQLPEVGGGGNTYQQITSAAHPSEFHGRDPSGLGINPTYDARIARIGNKFYVAGGASTTTGAGAQVAQAWFRVYDLDTDAWALLTAMPAARASGHLVWNTGDFLYYIFGWSGQEGVSQVWHNQIYRYSISGDTWTTIHTGTPYPSPANLDNLHLFFAWWHSSTLYVAGGVSAQLSVATARRRDVYSIPDTGGSWTLEGSLRVLADGRSAATITNECHVALDASTGEAYIVGGLDGGATSPGGTQFLDVLSPVLSGLDETHPGRPERHSYGEYAVAFAEGLVYTFGSPIGPDADGYDCYAYVPKRGVLNPFTGEAAV